MLDLQSMHLMFVLYKVNVTHYDDRSFSGYGKEWKKISREFVLVTLYIVVAQTQPSYG